MRVLFTLWGPSVGGSETAVRTLCTYLNDSGHRALAVALTDNGDLSSFFAARKVPLIGLGLERGSQILRSRRRVGAVLSEQAPDLVVVESFGYVGPLIRLAGYRGPLWGVEHGGLLVNRLNRRSRVQEYAVRSIARAFYDGEVAVSEFMAEVVRHYPHGRRLHVIPNPARIPDEVPAFPPLELLTLGFAGRLVRGKGVDRALRLLAALEAREVTVRLEVAGDGPDRPRLEALARELGLGDRVCFRGWIEDIGLHWSRCHVALALNDTFVESFCVSIAEALAHGRPALVTRNGALPALLDQPNCGTIWDGEDVSAVTAFLDQVRQPQSLALYAECAARSATRFAPAHVADRFLELGR